MTSKPIGSIWCEVCSAFVRDSSHLLKQPHEIAILDDLNLTPPTQQPDDALRVAAREALDWLDRCLVYGNLPQDKDDAVVAFMGRLRGVLKGAPWEPSEEMVERAVEWMRQVPVWDEGELMPDAWPNLALAALRAAFGGAAGR